MRTFMRPPLWRALLTALVLVTTSMPPASGRAVDMDAAVEPRSDLEARAVYPDSDPFYKPPPGFESTEPGTILRQRRVIAGFFGFIPSPVETWQLLYRTTATDGSPISTVTTIFKPFGAKLDRFVSFQTAYDSSATKCHPSYTYQLAAAPEELITAFERLILAGFLLSGYIVAAPDYEGPEAAFLVGRVEGMGTLDGMRAVRNFAENLGMTTTNPAIVGVGYSGGGFATSTAASMQGAYAPELNVKGWSAGGVPVNLTLTVEQVDGTVFSGFAPVSINGLLKPTAYKKQLQPVIDRIIQPKGADFIKLAQSFCVVPVIAAFVGQSILDTDFQSLGPEFLHEPTFREVLDSMGVGSRPDEVPVAPLNLFHGALDQIAPYDPASDLAEEWCSKGASVHFTNLAAGGHITSEILGLLISLQFTADAFDGKLSPGCSRKTVLDETLNPIGVALNLEPIIFALIHILMTVGRGDSNVISNPALLNSTIPI